MVIGFILLYYVLIGYFVPALISVILFFLQDTPCAEAPCRNGATCSNDGDDFKCTCAAGYAGKRCETRSKLKSYNGLGDLILRTPLYDKLQRIVAHISFATQMF
jgi:hypothetical protein